MLITRQLSGVPRPTIDADVTRVGPEVGVALSGADRRDGACTGFAESLDGTRIAYEVTGTGPVLLLLHGGGQTRRVWHDTGYVARLATEFTVVTIDLRGNGDSDRPESAAAYAIERLTADVLAVADAVDVGRFTQWGFSYGANVGRYVAARSPRVRAMVYIGIPFGPAATGAFRASVVAMCAKWAPIVEAWRAGELDEQSLSEPDRAAWRLGTVPVRLAALGALLDYPSIEPGDLRCPTLWLVGTGNDDAMASVRQYQPKLTGTQITVALLEGLTHPEELEHLDQTLPKALKFTRANQ